MKVTVMGLGFIGRPLAAAMARVGLNVVGVDPRQEARDEFVALGVSNLSNLVISDRPAVNSDVYVIAVGTPISTKTISMDCSQILSVLETLGPELVKGDLLIIESTLYPGGTEHIERRLQLPQYGSHRIGDIDIAYCPERVFPGERTMDEIVYLSRIIGGTTKVAGQRAAAFYRLFTKGTITVTDAKTAEMVKLMENIYRDVNIALANEFGLQAEKIGVDITKAIKYANQHPRVDILQPGIGVGGACLPYDAYFLSQGTNPNDGTGVLALLARGLNDAMPSIVAKRLHVLLSSSRDMTKPIALLGLSYKPNVADLRESPAMEVGNVLRKMGYDLQGYDPLVWPAEWNLLKIAEESSVLIVLVEHNEIMRQLEDYRPQIDALIPVIRLRSGFPHFDTESPESVTR